MLKAPQQELTNKSRTLRPRGERCVQHFLPSLDLVSSPWLALKSNNDFQYVRPSEKCRGSIALPHSPLTNEPNINQNIYFSPNHSSYKLLVIPFINVEITNLSLDYLFKCSVNLLFSEYLSEKSDDAFNGLQ